jgi:1-deoxy-D-xylulose-5-phosphate synthase
MRDGTGLGEFAKEFPDRFFDVGIAEGHMVAFAAGLAAAGMRPVVAVYSTFMQRAADQIMHDVAIAGLPVVFCVDRAGVVGADGVTHQGVFDIAWMRSLPNMTLCQPKDDDDLNALLKESLVRNGPTIIRYPRGAVPAADDCRCDGALSAQLCRADAKTQIWAAGDQIAKARAVADRTGAGVVFARYLKPFDSNLLAAQRAAGMRIVTLENGVLAGGFGEAIGADLKFGWPDEFVPHGTLSELEEKYRFDEASIMEAING